MAMTQNDFDFERDLSDAFAPVRMSADLQQRLLQVPQVHAQRPASWINRLVPSAWLHGLRSLSMQPAFGMTTSVAAACCSLVIGISLGLGGVLPQVTAKQIAATSGTTTVASSAATAGSTSDSNDPVSILFAAADMPGDLP